MRNLLVVGLIIAALIFLNELRFLHGRSVGLALTIMGLSIVAILQSFVVWNVTKSGR